MTVWVGIGNGICFADGGAGDSGCCWWVILVLGATVGITVGAGVGTAGAAHSIISW